MPTRPRPASGGRRPDGMQGRSLVPLLPGRRRDLNLDAYCESLYARNHYGWSELRSLRSGRFKFIATTQARAVRSRAGSAGAQEPVSTSAARWPTAWRRNCSRLGAEPARGTNAPAAVDPETRERLAALGYIGIFTQRRAPAGETLPDPKDKIEIFNLMTSAHESNGRRSRPRRSRG